MSLFNNKIIVLYDKKDTVCAIKLYKKNKKFQYEYFIS